MYGDKKVVQKELVISQGFAGVGKLSKESAHDQIMVPQLLKW
jgi:hypothetical protein